MTPYHPPTPIFTAFPLGVGFDPTGKQEPGVMNLWEGFAVEPKQGDWLLLRSHILNVICDGQQHLRRSEIAGPPYPFIIISISLLEKAYGDAPCTKACLARRTGRLRPPRAH